MAINTNHTKNKISATDADLVLDTENPQSNISASLKRLVNVQDPVNEQDAVTKKFLTDQLAAITGGVSTDLGSIQNILDKLTPPGPDSISDQVISVIGTSSARITDFTQTDNSNTGLSATPGSIVQHVKRDNDFQISTITQVGPGDSGTLEIVRNGNTTSSVTFDETLNNGTTTDVDTIIVSNNIDYGTISGDPLGFNFIYDAIALGTNTVSEGWNTVKLKQGNLETNTVTWYSDQSDPGVPQVSNISISPNSTEHKVYSSSVPHYTYQQQFNISFDVNRLSGDFYPATDNFIDASASLPIGSGLRALSDIDYTTAGITTPLPRNYLVASGSATISTTANVQYGTGVSIENTGPSVTIDNSYHTVTVNFPVAEKILYMFDDFTSGTPVDETRIIVDNVGFGSGDARRLESPGTDNPSMSVFDNFDGETSILGTHDATVVGGRLSHDTTDYSVGYLPVGPDLSSGRDGSQYIVFAFNRSAVSKFAVEWSGKVSGFWVKLPGAITDTTSNLNGWLDASLPYEGIGVPGENTGSGGNGSNGCGLSGTVSLGQFVTNETANITFGTASSSSATDNLILARIKLNSGDYVTKLKFKTATA